MSFTREFIKFCNLQRSTKTFILQPFIQDQPLVGEYFIYQKNIHQPMWASYNLQKLKDICETEGGYVSDKGGNILFFKHLNIK